MQEQTITSSLYVCITITYLLIFRDSLETFSVTLVMKMDTHNNIYMSVMILIRYRYQTYYVNDIDKEKIGLLVL